MDFDQLANATVRVESGAGSGSGFHAFNDGIVLTNHHVVEPTLVAGAPLRVISEAGNSADATVIGFSNKSEHDFAILQLNKSLGPNRKVLVPTANDDAAPRGVQVLFAGFPHGIHDLLVHSASVSGPYGNLGFHVDGSVNGGNSGGPIVDAATGDAVGMIAARRLVGVGQLEHIGNEAQALMTYCGNIAAQGSVQIMGIDFGQFAGMTAQSFSFVKQIVEANANSGIGIGFHIKFVRDECLKLGLAP